MIVIVLEAKEEPVCVTECASFTIVEDGESKDILFNDYLGDDAHECCCLDGREIKCYTKSGDFVWGYRWPAREK